MNLTKKMVAALGATLLSGCASIMDGSTQSISIQPMRNGVIAQNTTCTITNSKGSWVVPGGSSVVVKKSRADLNVSCADNSTQHTGIATGSRSTQVGYAVANFFIWDLCTISCIIDFGTGAIYEYPSQVVVPMPNPQMTQPSAMR